jgi:cytochrome bd-type quinol oxidase subunit 2
MTSNPNRSPVSGSPLTTCAGLVVFPIVLIYTGIVYWIFRGKVREEETYS